MAVRGEGGVEDLCLEMLLHIAPLSQFMYSILGYFCNCRVGKPESETDCHTKHVRNSSCRMWLD